MSELSKTLGDQAISTATAKAEIAVEKILSKLEKDTRRKIKTLSVDTENFKTCSVEIFLTE